MFGASLCSTAKNIETIGSEEYVDWLTEQGCSFSWIFTYVPMGKDAKSELMISSKQREWMYSQVRKLRTTKPIFLMDFWNDGEYVQGCLAGGRFYLHVNANGDIEPCAFVHYSDSNIKDTTILQACRKPLFRQFHNKQPLNKNHLRPCPLLVEIVERTGAKSTHMNQEECVRDLCAKCKGCANKWKPVADKIWKETKSDQKQFYNQSDVYEEKDRRR